MSLYIWTIHLSSLRFETCVWMQMCQTWGGTYVQTGFFTYVQTGFLTYVHTYVENIIKFFRQRNHFSDTSKKNYFCDRFFHFRNRGVYNPLLFWSNSRFLSPFPISNLQIIRQYFSKKFNLFPIFFQNSKNTKTGEKIHISNYINIFLVFRWQPQKPKKKKKKHTHNKKWPFLSDLFFVLFFDIAAFLCCFPSGKNRFCFVFFFGI